MVSGQIKGWRRRELQFCALMVVSCTLGCASKREPAPWVPHPVVQWDQITTNSVIPVRDGYQIQVPSPTRGLFPASLGITRVAVVEQPTEAGVPVTKRVLYKDPRNEFLHWNRTMDDLLAVSEVFPVGEVDLGGGPAEPEQIVAAFDALHAKLGLIYAVNELTRHNVEMFGVLYETQTGQPVASVHAQAESKPTLRDADEDDSVNLWESDARALVRERFRGYVHACVRELILQDELEIVEVPAGWTPDHPVRPVVWPPRTYPYRP